MKRERVCVTTVHEHCSLQLVILVVTPKQGLDPAVAFPDNRIKLFEKTEAGCKLYRNTKTPMFSVARTHLVPVFDTIYVPWGLEEQG